MQIKSTCGAWRASAAAAGKPSSVPADGCLLLRDISFFNGLSEPETDYVALVRRRKRTRRDATENLHVLAEPHNKAQQPAFPAPICDAGALGSPAFLQKWRHWLRRASLT